MTHGVFVTGATGYLGRHLLPALAARGHRVRALVRPGSESRLPAGIDYAVGDVLNRRSFGGAMSSYDTLVHLVGTSRPSPAKAKQFRQVDLVSAREALLAAAEAGVRHFIYVSVAQPAPVMRSYVAVRAEAERMVRESGLSATVLRPWYVLGPGHRWPYLLLPFYWLCERLPPTREGARRLGLVTVGHMISALVQAVEQPATGVRILTVSDIRAAPPL